MLNFKCPSGGGKDCPTTQLCAVMCHFQTAEGGRFVDTHIHEPTPLPRQQFQPDFGIEHHAALRWHQRLNVWQWAMVIGTVIGFAVGAYRRF